MTSNACDEETFQRGICHFYGLNYRRKDERKARILLKESARSGHACARGICLLEGWETSGDAERPILEEEAAKLFHMKALEGCGVSMYKLGICYQYGIGVRKDERIAVKWYFHGSKAGNPLAQYNLGVCFDQGNGVKKNITCALKWYQKSAEQGHADAACNFALCSDQGSGTDFREAINWLQKAACSHDPHAQFIYGVFLEEGKGVVKDVQEAVSWYEAAAKQGHRDSCYNLAVLYDLDLVAIKRFIYDTPQEREDARLSFMFSWFQKAAEYGDQEAQYRTAQCLEFGEGVKVNKSLSLSFYRLAAKNGHAKAARKLVRVYASGKLGTSDKVQAKFWRRIASRYEGCPEEIDEELEREDQI